MEVKKNNPYKTNLPSGGERKPKEKSLSKKVYEALVDVNDSCEVEYLNSSTLNSLRTLLRTQSLIHSNGVRRYKLRDNGNKEKIIIYRVS